MSNRIPDETRQAIALDYLAGMKMTKIADKYGVSYGTVSRIVDDTKMGELKEKSLPLPKQRQTPKRKSCIMMILILSRVTQNSRKVKASAV